MQIVRYCLLLALLPLPLFSAGEVSRKLDTRVRMVFNSQNEFAVRTFNLIYNAGVRCPDSLSMFLASAITETGWGTSYKFRKHNNLFGVVGRSYTSREAAVRHRLNFRNGWEKVGPNKDYKPYIERFARKLKQKIQYEATGI